MERVKKGKMGYYFVRFVCAHILAYSIIAVMFLVFQNMLPDSNRLALELYQPFRSLSVLTIIGQILRGTLLGVLLYPFYHYYIEKKHGWLLLYLLLAGLTILGSPIFITDAIEGTFSEFLDSFFVGGPEIFSQMLIFSVLFFLWQRKNEKK